MCVRVFSDNVSSQAVKSCNVVLLKRFHIPQTPYFLKIEAVRMDRAGRIPVSRPTLAVKIILVTSSNPWPGDGQLPDVPAGTFEITLYKVYDFRLIAEVDLS